MHHRPISAQQQVGRILVIGATGKAGVEVRAMVRDPGNAVFPAGVELARGDLSDPMSLELPLLDVDAVFLMWPFQVRTGVVRATGGPDVRAVIHEADIAAVAVQALTGDALVGTRPELTGPEALTTAEQALAIGEALGMPVRFEEISPEAAREQAVAAGYPTDLVEALFDGTRAFTPQQVTGKVEEITGTAPRSVRQWARDHAEAFR